jgi:hypothetical protein
MTSVSGPRVDPAPLFDLVTGFPPDDAVDVTVPMPLSLAVYMTMLESTGHATELATLRKLQMHAARETARGIQAWVGELIGSGAATSARLRVTHIVEERVPRVNGLRPHVHAYIGATVRDPTDGRELPVDVERLAVLADSDLFPDYRDRLATVTAERVGLVWEETTWSAREVVGPSWLTERLAALGHDELPCRGPWPRHQIVAGRRRSGHG